MAIFRSLLFITCVFQIGLALPTKNKLRDVEWFEEGQKSLGNLLKSHINSGIAKNVIIFIGDGMGISTMTAARLLKAQQENRSLFETRLSWETFLSSSIVLPYNVDQFTAESAGSASAILTGVKTNAGTLSVNQKAVRGICESGKGNAVKSILHHSHDQGKWTGVLTTESITGATPAASYAHTPERDWSRDTNTPSGCKDIAAQLVEDNDFIRVVLGGGRVNFMTSNETDVAYGTKGGREDRNLIEVWKEKQALKVERDVIKYVTNKTDFDAVDASKVEYLLGLFEPGKMHYEVDRTDETMNKDPEPSLTEMVEKAINILKRNDDGFFLLAEGAKIDNGHHASNAYRALTETLALSDAVKKAEELTNEEDTLIVVTADHSHTFTINGYPHPDNDILGLARTPKVGTHDELEFELGEDGLPYLTLSYGVGEGYMYHKTNDSFNGRPGRRNLTQEEAEGKTRDKDYKQDAAIPKDDETHGGEDVAAYARGPMSHLFRGAQEQSLVAHIMMYASCVGPNRDHCKEVPVPSGNARNKLAMSLLLLPFMIIWSV